jgi:hypothetical protein
METLVFEALENFKHFDDLELKCMVSDYWYIETHNEFIQADCIMF